ncbi:thiamine pyrophosphate-binding protein [Sphingomonas sp. MMSM20]|uniref:thiamine pyrophosphate-binding protein n=1 Tax=Sphingomonas lycopersici TaxID=2951807 RepID=UPI0022379C86|nr:thiamine pyrophosphate-binding protein [Sphingomonas lycopersici]MCW6529849.1 thiamine pyrophosphate-binding protein [Sphingomonas lycopersici]
MSGTIEAAKPGEMTGGQALVAQLIVEGAKDIFAIPGIQLDWAVDAIRQRSNELRLIVPRHEQATSYMADGYARTTGREAVCMVVPGPGMLNALSGIATAYACNAPVLFIVGQIPSDTIGAHHGMLHEIPDQSGVLKAMTKWHGIAKTPADIPGLVHEAFVQLRSGTPRPVALEVPPDVLQSAGVVTLLPRAERVRQAPAAEAIARAAEALTKARHPVICAGGGAVASQATAEIQALAERLQAPVVMTEAGRGLIDDRHPLALIGLGGRAVLPHADVVLVAGSRFLDGTATPTDKRDGVTYIYLNTDPNHMGAPRAAGIVLEGDVQEGARALLAAIGTGEAPAATDRIAKVKQWCAQQIEAIRPQHDYVQALRGTMADDDILVSELTQVGYYSNIAFPVYGPHRFITPGYQGTLGYGFNTALGAAHGNPHRRTVSLNGDGGFSWGMQELATLARDQLNLSVVVFVDGKFGNVQRIQRRVFGAEFGTDVASPDFALLGQAYGLPTVVTDSPEGLAEALRNAKQRGGPALIAVKVGEMPSPWALIHPFVPSPVPVPPNPLGEPA